MEIRLPRLGEGANSGVVAGILVKEGEKVRKDQTILELESDKAVAAIPVPEAGTVAKISVKEGDEIKVGDLILTLKADGGKQEIASSQPPTQEVPQPTMSAQRGKEQPSRSPVPQIEGIPLAAAPSLRKIARELGIDLTRVRGSERGGRIVLADVRQYLAELQKGALAPPPPTSSVATVSPPDHVDFSKWGSVRRKKITSIRKTIAQRMSSSWNVVPHVTQFEDADITDLLALRKAHSAAYEKKGGRLTLTPLIIKALVRSLQQHQMFNASLDEGSGEIIYKDYYHIGIAVDTEQGLLVPVLRDADKKSVLDISLELEDLAGRARDRKIAIDEMQGGTFTISNQGGIGGAHFTPIVNKPEVAILGLGRGALRAVVRNKKIEQRVILPLGLSYDHRIIDGADAARFITTLVQAIESFDEKELALAGRGSKKKPAKKGKK